MAHSKIFKTNRSQAVRLPKAVAFPDTVREVEIVKLGQTRLIVPVGLRWDDFFRSGPSVSEDFMQDREQPVTERREPL
jgi:antitoxin VapB